MERRLAAVLVADMVGYSRLIEADEEQTIARQKAHRIELIDPMIVAHRGRIVSTAGDGLLAEFPSVVDAVNCAVAIQRAMAEREANSPEDRRIRYRIGVNLGDIVIDGDDILGDGVNVAARLEGLAEPGGICIPRKVLREIGNKVDVGFEFISEQKVKNIEALVPVYRVLMDTDAAGKVLGERPRAKPLRQLAAIAAAILAVIAAGIAWWQPWQPREEPAGLDRMAFPLPDKPSIAVLPFTNMSEDGGQEYFADGMTEDLITDLSKVSGLFVIARNSVFTYKGRSVNVRQVAEELGVRYVLEGSVRRAGDQIRINAQLIDATTGGHLWADRYDGSLADVFGLQDKVTREVVTSLAVELGAASQARLMERETDSAEAYEAFLRGWAYYRRNTPDDYADAIPYFERAVALDPDYGRAYAALAAVYWKSVAKNVTGRGGLWAERLGLTHEETRSKAFSYLQEALKSPTPLALLVASSVKTHQGRHEDAIAQAREALELDPNDPSAYEALGIALIYGGKSNEGAEAIRAAMRLDPQHRSLYLGWLGLAEFNLGRYAQAVTSLREGLQGNPEDDTAMIALLACYGHLGQAEEGRELLQALNDLRQRRQQQLEKIGSGSIEAGIDSFLLGPYTLDDVNLWPFEQATDRDRLREGLQKAGVPETAPDDAVSPVFVEGAATVSPAEAKELFDSGVPFVDVRTLARWSVGRIPGAVLLDLKGGFTEASLLNVAGKDGDVVIYCEGPVCLRSSQACAMAVSWGFERVHYLRLGFPGWRAEGYPVEVD